MLCIAFGRGVCLSFSFFNCEITFFFFFFFSPFLLFFLSWSCWGGVGILLLLFHAAQKKGEMALGCVLGSYHVRLLEEDLCLLFVMAFG